MHTPNERNYKEKAKEARLKVLPWNKGKKGLQVAWNKGMKMTGYDLSNVGKSEGSSLTQFKIGHALVSGVEIGWFKKGIQNNPNGGFSAGHVPFNKGQKHLGGEKHPNWKGGITPQNVKIRNSPEMKAWRLAVFKRDGFQCIWGGKAHGNKLNADHIKRFSEYPSLRFDVTNGRTLCVDCHKKLGTYYGK